MKTLFLALTLVLSVSANAKVLAEVSVGGGLRAPNNCGTHKITVDDSGFVTGSSCNDGYIQLAKLSHKVVLKLTAQINSIEISALEKPNRLGCMDAPSTFYSVAQHGGAMKPIAANVNCIDLEMKTNSYEVSGIRDLLKGLLAVSDF